MQIVNSSQQMVFDALQRQTFRIRPYFGRYYQRSPENTKEALRLYKRITEP
jgi:hypothetical protein